MLFPGNRQSIESSGRGPRIDVYEGTTYMSTCGGGPGIELIVDEGALLLSLGGFSCADPETTNRTFEVTVTACINGPTCQHPSATTSVTLGGPAVAAQLCEPIDPPPPCDSCSCKVGGGNADGPPSSPKTSSNGGAGGSGGTGMPIGGGGAQAAPAGQAGTTLRYTAGGAGTTGTPGAVEWQANLGRGWSHDFAERIVVAPDYQHVWFITRNANFVEFSDPSGGGASLLYATVAPSDEFRKLYYDTGTGAWQLHWLDGTVQYFSNAGRWLSTVDRNGNAWEATSYTGDKIQGVTFPDGRSEIFTYDVNGKLGTVVLAGVGGSPTRTWFYQWAGNDLYRIYQPDNRFRRFEYQSDYGYMTRQILVGNGGNPLPERIEAAWEYDPFGNAVRFWRGAATFGDPAGADNWEVTFDDPANPTQATVIDPLGGTSIYTLGRDTVSTRVKVLSIDGACPTCGSSPDTTFTYDTTHPLLVATETDGRGVRTDFTYDAYGRRASRTDAATTTGDPNLPRITEWQYDANFPAFVTSIDGPTTVGDTPSRLVTMTYNAATGNLESRTIVGNESTYPGGLFNLQTAYAGYNAAGGVGTVDPPGYGATDQTTYTYDVPGRNGMLADTRTDPLVGTWHFAYDNDNRRTGVTDPNQAVTETAYDALNRVTSVIARGDPATSADDRTTTYTYNRMGDLYCVKSPTLAGTEYLYDDLAGRLTEVRRGTAVTTPTFNTCLTVSATNIAERRLWALDKGGHRTNEKLDRGTTVWTPEAETSYVYSSMCHLDKTIQAPGKPEESITEYDYDCGGNLSQVWDPLHPRATYPLQPSTAYAYDELNRLTSVTRPWAEGGVVTTSYFYDVQDHLIELVDANGTSTTYDYSDRDLLTGQVSEVSGTSTHIYNEHGETVSETDGRGVTTLREVDAADRVTLANPPGTALDTSYSYGSTPAPVCDVGRLTGITRNASTVPYSYNCFDEVTTDGSLTFTRDKHGNPLTITYPGALQAIYTYDKMDRPISLQSKEGAAAAVYVVKNTPAPTYKAYGPLASLVFNTTTNRTESRGYDFRYQPTSIAISGSPALLAWDYTVDKIGNVVAIDDTTISNQDRTFLYQDWQYYLAAATGPWFSPRSYAYDRIGNRTYQDTGLVQNFTYQQNSSATGSTALLTSVCQEMGVFCPVLRTYSSDAGGYLDAIQAGANVIDFTFDAAGQLGNVNRNGGNQLVNSYDGRGFLATAVQLGGGSVTATYNSQGLLHSLGRLPSAGGSLERNNVLYFADRPVAIWKKVGAAAAVTTYLTTDHLGAPIFALNQAGAEFWKGGLEPFGRDWQEGTANDMLTKGIFLRLPGQWDDSYFDKTTIGADIYYNVHRWFEPQTGRYTRTDPLVLRPDPESNAFLYANANPLRFLDPLGLAAEVCCRLLDNFFAGTIARQRHCYVIGDSGTKYGLYPEDRNGQSIGVPRRNDPRDTGGRCESCEPECEDSNRDACLSQATDSYPVGGYSLFGPNSNTFAGTLARKCCKGGVPDGLGSAPGINDDPPAGSGGW